MGLRLQIVLAIAALMVLAFGPLFFAVASLTRATLLGAEERSARSLSSAIAARVSTALEASSGPDAVAQILREHVQRLDVGAACAFDAGGARIACAGHPADVASIRAPASDSTGSVRRLRDGAGGTVLEVASPTGRGTIVCRVDLNGEIDRGSPLVRLVALYMAVFAFALIVFAYFSLTRLIVRPIEQLATAADRVASGARTLRVPRSGARELVELAASVQSMAGKLIAEEATLLLKIEELTETTTRLTQARTQLVHSERMASVGRLAAGLAHEIGNPLAAILGMHELLLDEDLSRDVERDFLRRMRGETERIQSVVRDLLDFARPEGTGQSDRDAAAAADVEGVVDDVVALVQPQRPFRNVRFERQLAGAGRVAFAGSKLTQVLLNMILNAGAAVAATQRGSGRITLRATRIDDGARVRIEIEDDGPGVDPAVRDRLFEPFATTKDVGEGTGLGLAVCRGLIESVGGEVGLDASYTSGARFYVVLPAAA
ncbi:MAG TPA: HAMP domain-containing sensor histidine kinase [Polyangiaceae bacterium]|nr:HAMP domain-containing sensor histidine kinase [Polyangiaceae bacterium]